MSVQEAGSVWTGLRAGRNLKPRTHEFTQFALNSLSRFFGDLPLGAVTAGHLREYQLARAVNEVQFEDGLQRPWKRKAGNTCINHELNVLQQILVVGGLWPRIGPWYAPLKVPGWSPRVLIDLDQERHLFAAAAADPRAELALWVATITANTSASGSELRYIQLRHLFLRSPADGLRSEVYIPEEGCKNNARPRKLPLNNLARWAFEQCYLRALRLGSTRDEHYLFPFRVKRNEFDPARPASRSWIRKDWDRLRAVTGLPQLRPHDLRHLFATRLLEASVSPEIVQQLMGHKSPRMMDYYSHLRMEPKFAAVDAIEEAAIPRKSVLSVRLWPTAGAKRA
jgi:integrase